MDHHVISPWGCCPRKLSRQIVKPRARPDVDCGLPEQRMPLALQKDVRVQHTQIMSTEIFRVNFEATYTAVRGLWTA